MVFLKVSIEVCFFSSGFFSEFSVEVFYLVFSPMVVLGVVVSLFVFFMFVFLF